MRCVDVNVLVDAHRPEASRHGAVREWLDEARGAIEPLGVATLAASGFLRVVTHPRVFRDPTPLPTALDFVEALYESPSVQRIEPGERHWAVFTDLCTSMSLRGNDVPDAYLAAMAIEQGATWITSDRGFLAYPGVRVELPGAG